MTTSWWVTTVLGISGAIAAYLAVDCQLGPTICPILLAVAGASGVGLGISHPGFKNSDILGRSIDDLKKILK